MEEVYKKGSKYFGMSSGLEYGKDAVYETSEGCYWRCNPSGLTVVETFDPGDGHADDTRFHGGYAKNPPSVKGGY